MQRSAFTNVRFHTDAHPVAPTAVTAAAHLCSFKPSAVPPTSACAMTKFRATSPFRALARWSSMRAHKGKIQRVGRGVPV